MRDTLAEVRFRTLFEMAHDAILVVDGDSLEIADANHRAVEWLGRDAEELRGLRCFEIHPEAQRLELEQLYRARLRLGQSAEVSCELLRRDGGTFPCELSASPLVVDGRRMMIGVFRDVSEQRRAIEEIRLRNVAIASMRSGVSIADARLPDLPLIYVNKAFEKITGYQAREVVGRSCRFLQGAERDQPALDKVRTALREGRPCDVRLRNYRKDGTPFWNELHLSPVYDEDDSLTHFVGIQMDVTERVESRRRLEESERRYRTLADSVEDIIMRRNRGGDIFFVSPSVERNLGYHIHDLVHSDYLDLIHPEDRERFAERVAALGETQESATLTYRLRDAHGVYVWIESRETLLRGEGDLDEVVSVGRDVTLRQKAEEEVRRHLEREREVGQLKSRFIRMVSHEFRTPMTGIRASAAFLRDWGDKVSGEKRERHFENIEKSLSRMNRMLDDVLFISRNEVKRVLFAPNALHPQGFCEQVIEEVRPIFQDRRIDLRVAPEAQARFELDPDLLRHIFQNLLSNALKYSPPDQAVDLSITLDHERGELVWQVRDRGIGIPASSHPTLYEPFSRADNCGTVGGTGLGLYIVKRSVELHGGDIFFESQEGQGSTFEVRLPAIPS